MIALRAQREAMQIADPIWYPLQQPPPPPLPEMPGDRWVPPRISLVQPPPPEPAPAWLVYLFIACLTAITIVTLVLLKHVG